MRCKYDVNCDSDTKRGAGAEEALWQREAGECLRQDREGVRLCAHIKGNRKGEDDLYSIGAGSPGLWLLCPQHLKALSTGGQSGT